MSITDGSRQGENMCPMMQEVDSQKLNEQIQICNHCKPECALLGMNLETARQVRTEDLGMRKTDFVQIS